MTRFIYIIAIIAIPTVLWGSSIFDTGLPYIEINTENGDAIASKTEYVGMTFAFTDPRDPGKSVRETALSCDTGSGDAFGKIRGRGNNTWHGEWAVKKSYRVKLADRVSLFGLEPARNWVLLAQHRDETLLFNAIPLELGRRFGMRFNHSVNFVDLYINGEYMGNYLLTEHRNVSKGRIDIDRREGWFIELDEYFDEEPKFRTADYDLPIMIKFPGGKNTAAHERIKNDMFALTAAMASPDFPESGYREMIDMDAMIAFLMINEIVANTDLSHPRSTFAYKDKDAPIAMGPLWDFDSGYGWNYRNWLESGFNDHFNFPDRRHPTHAFFRRFYDDPVFRARFRETWNARYGDILSMTAYIDSMAAHLEKSAEVNFKHWWYKTYAPFTDTRPPMHVDHKASIAKLKQWYEARVYYLNVEFNKMDTLAAPPPVPVSVTAIKEADTAAAPHEEVQGSDSSVTPPEPDRKNGRSRWWHRKRG